MFAGKANCGIFNEGQSIVPTTESPVCEICVFSTYCSTVPCTAYSLL